ncbi:MAG: glycosyltransferase family 2 protein [Phycisphaerae bacterium]|nr:glycosyltransferase family 2 protein [Phycisphaerae bacterium]
MLVSVVIPVFNEDRCLEALLDKLIEVANAGPIDYEYIFVNDGSTDGSLAILRRFAQEHHNVKYISFSRNFGHEAATTAGLDHTSGDAVVIMDADLQHPPEVVPEMIQKWQQGHQIVYAQRRSRTSETAFKRATSWLFYRIIRWLSDADIPPDTGDFRLMDKYVVDQVRRCRERSRFVRALIAWTGFRQTAVLYDEQKRFAGETKYGVFKLIRLAFDAVLGFSDFPLRIGVVLGLVVCFLSVAMGIIVVVQKLVWGIPISGYATLVTGIFFLGGVQLLVIGLLGEYISRIYVQSQFRPLYIIAEKSDALPKGEQGWYGLSPSLTENAERARSSSRGEADN